MEAASSRSCATISSGFSLECQLSADEIGHLTDGIEIFDDDLGRFDFDLELGLNKGDQLHGAMESMTPSARNEASSLRAAPWA